MGRLKGYELLVTALLLGIIPCAIALLTLPVMPLVQWLAGIFKQ